MSYQRVLPRDLFNEANLLKCYGQLWLKLERYFGRGVSLPLFGESFAIEQDPDDGSLTVTNVRLFINGEAFSLWRPLNSREPWPLYAGLWSGDEHAAVFTDQGELTEEFKALLPAR